MKFVGPARGLWKLLGDIKVDDLQRLADLNVTILVTGTSLTDCDSVVSHLSTNTGQANLPNRCFRSAVWPIAPNQLVAFKRIDMVIFVTGRNDPVPAGELEVLRGSARGLTPLVTVIHGSRPEQPAAQNVSGPSGVFEKTVHLERLESTPVIAQVPPVIVDLLPDQAVALGRAFTPFRQAASTKVIYDTSWTNAKFAGLSNVSAIVPVVGNLLAATADLLVLTRNQIVMLLKIAAIYGRDLRHQRDIIMEILPVVGAAFVWRTVARETAALIPGFLGAIPKVFIAYAGTYTVGQAAKYFYHQGRKPPAQLMRSFYARASEQASLQLRGLLSNVSPRRTRPDRE